jgi:DNA-binding transcriptional ArsR family regulator
LDEVKKERPDVLLVDSCDKDKNAADSLRQITKVMKKGVLLTSWTHHHWNQLRDSLEESAPVSKEIFTEPVSKDDTSQLVTNIVQKSSKGKVKLPAEIPEAIHGFSKGIPGVTINLLHATFNQAFVKGVDKAVAENVGDAAETLGIKGVDEKVAKLPEHQLLLIKHILLETDKRGIRPSRLVELLNKDKATISYHLNSLLSERLLTAQRLGRYSFYRVRPEIEPFVQLRIARESE